MIWTMKQIECSFKEKWALNRTEESFSGPLNSREHRGPEFNENCSSTNNNQWRKQVAYLKEDFLSSELLSCLFSFCASRSYQISQFALNHKQIVLNTTEMIIRNIWGIINDKNIWRIFPDVLWFDHKLGIFSVRCVTSEEILQESITNDYKRYNSNIQIRTICMRGWISLRIKLLFCIRKCIGDRYAKAYVSCQLSLAPFRLAYSRKLDGEHILFQDETRTKRYGYAICHLTDREYHKPLH